MPKIPRLELHSGRDMGAVLGTKPIYPYATVEMGGDTHVIRPGNNGPAYDQELKLPATLLKEVEEWFAAFYLLQPRPPTGSLWVRQPGRRITVGLIGCGKTKREAESPARDLYLGDLFKKSRAWVERRCQEWGILSAKHGLLMPDELVEPYDQTLAKMDREWKQGWAQRTSYQVYLQWGEDTDFVLLAGEEYRQPFEEKFMRGETCTTKVPMQGLGLGEQLGWLKRELGDSGQIYDGGSATDGAS